FYYHSKSKKLKNYRHSAKQQSISSNHIRKLVQDKFGRIWMGTFGEGIDVFDPIRKTVKNFNTRNSKLSNNFILTLYSDLEGNIWAGTFSGGLNVWLKNSNTFRN